MSRYIGFLISSVFTALNFMIWLADHKIFNAGAALFCGAMTLYMLFNRD